MRFARSIRAVSSGWTAAIGVLMVAPLQPSRAQGDTEVLTNATVVQMVAGKLSKDLIVGKINSARPGFDLSSDGIISLVSFKVDQNILKLMLQVSDNARRSGSALPTLVGLDEVLSNEIVVRMLSGKVPKQIVLAKIQMSRSAFDVSSSGLVSLTTSKVPEDVIKAMMLPPPPAPAVAPIPVREPTAPAPTVVPAKPAAGSPTTAKPKTVPPKSPAPKTPPPPPPTRKPPVS